MRKDPSEYYGRNFRFDDESEEIEALSVSSALGMAVMEKLGIVNLIDDNTKWDSQRVLSPGKAAKAICGTMFTHNIKSSLTNIQDFYSYAMVDTLFGSMADHASLNDVSLGRAMDSIYDADVETLFYSIASRAKLLCNLRSRFCHLDASNITVQCNIDKEFDTDAAKPRFGRPKDGHTDRLQYNFESAVDDNGIPMYFCAHDGNRTDNQMDMRALEMMNDYLSDERIVAVADCKLVDAKTVDYLIWSNIPFVSKCPDNFAGRVKQSVIDAAMEREFTSIGKIGKRKDAPEYEICDIDAEANGERLRFIAYREVGVKHSLGYYREQVLKEMRTFIRSIEKKSFACEDDVRLEIERAQSKVKAPYKVEFIPENKTVTVRRKGRGRPEKDYVPVTKEEWSIRCDMTFDEELALKLAKRRDIRVIVTSLPRSDKAEECIADGCTGADVLRIYCGQWRIENVFGEMKSKLGADDVFFETPERENVMLFLISLAVLIRRIMQILLREEYGKGFGIPKDITTYRMFRMVQNTTVRFDRCAERIYLDGPSEEKNWVKIFSQILDIDPSRLIG